MKDSIFTLHLIGLLSFFGNARCKAMQFHRYKYAQTYQWMTNKWFINNIPLENVKDVIMFINLVSFVFPSICAPSLSYFWQYSEPLYLSMTFGGNLKNEKHHIYWLLCVDFILLHVFYHSHSQYICFIYRSRMICLFLKLHREKLRNIGTFYLFKDQASADQVLRLDIITPYRSLEPLHIRL